MRQVLKTVTVLLILIPAIIRADNTGPNTEKDTYFLLGMLQEYISRKAYDNSDKIEGFYWGEELHAYVMVAYLNRIMNETGISSSVYLERKQELLISLHSKELTDYLNSFYIDQPYDWKGLDMRGRDIYLPYSAFENASKDAKLAYLAGAYYRWGRNYRYDFTNGKKKADLVAQLLIDIGSSLPDRSMSADGLVPRSHYIDFQPTDELQQWFEKYPELWALEAADTLIGFAKDQEINIYRKITSLLQNDIIGGYSVTVPCVVSRISGIRGDGARKMNDLSPEWESVLEDFNDRRTTYISLKNLASDSIIVDHEHVEKREHSQITFLRLGFSDDMTRAMSFLSHNRKIYTLYFTFKEEEWTFYSYDISDHWRE